MSSFKYYESAQIYKGAAAIINKECLLQHTINNTKEEDAENADVHDARQDEHKCKDNETYHSILEARKHKLRMERGKKR